MSKASIRLIPKYLRDLINEHKVFNDKVDGMKVFSILHLKDGVSAMSRRYVVYIHTSMWPALVWDFTNEVWYYNIDSHAASEVEEHIKGERRPAKRELMVEIASYGVAGAVQRKMLEVTRGSK